MPSAGSGTRSCHPWHSCSMPLDRRPHRRSCAWSGRPPRGPLGATRSCSGTSGIAIASSELIAIERLAAPGPASDAAAKALDDVLLDDVHHAARILAALMAIPATGDDVRETDGPLRRALDDELDLVRRRVMASRLARHGSERLGPAIIALDAGGPTGALGLWRRWRSCSAPPSRASSIPLLAPGHAGRGAAGRG